MGARVRRSRRPGFPASAAALAAAVVAVVLLTLGVAEGTAPFSAGTTLPTPVTTPPSPYASPLSAGEAGSVDPVAVRRALADGLTNRRLGRHVVAAVADLSGGPAVYATSSGTPRFTPASTTKLVTTASALHVLGPGHVFTTTVVARGRDVVLVGGGDPFLMSRPVRHQRPSGTAQPQRADIRTLARETAAALHASGRDRVRVGYDTSLFTGPEASPGWRPDYLPDGVVAPITALWVDEGRDPDGYGRVDDPAAYAAQQFVSDLERAGITVRGEPTPRRAPASASTLAEVHSPPLGQIVERVLEVSDNEAAEVLAHQVGVATVGEGSFAGGVRGVEQTLRELGVPTRGLRLYDGSGLSHRDRTLPATLLAVLQAAAATGHPELRAVLTGLPVAGFNGSLTWRFDQGPPAGRGQVRAKTGTLTGVSSLAGLATDRTGSVMVFVLAADRVRLPNTLAARGGLDALAASLAACSCSG